MGFYLNYTINYCIVHVQRTNLSPFGFYHSSPRQLAMGHTITMIYIYDHQFALISLTRCHHCLHIFTPATQDSDHSTTPMLGNLF